MQVLKSIDYNDDNDNNNDDFDNTNEWLLLFCRKLRDQKVLFFYVVNIYTFQFKKFTVQGNIKDSLKIHSKVK